VSQDTLKTTIEVTNLGESITSALTQALTAISQDNNQMKINMMSPTYERDKEYIDTRYLKENILPKLSHTTEKNIRFSTWTRVHLLHKKLRAI
jgi:hypothetical protein